MVKKVTAMYKINVPITKAKINIIKSLKKDKRYGYNKTRSFRKVKTFRNIAGQNINLFELRYE